MPGQLLPQRGAWRGWLRERVLIIGVTPMSHRIAREVESRARSRYQILGALDDGRPAPGDVRVLGSVADLAAVVERTRPSRVVVALEERRRRTPVRALLEFCVARGIAVEDAAQFFERITGTLAIESLAPTSIVFCRKFGPTRAQQVFSRAVSLAVAIAGLALLAPLMALIALAIKLDSRGPVLFVHPRIGHHGRPFRLLKFRTMTTAMPQRSEWERDNRHRVTRVGRVLRAFRLDELPQFINIVRGEMNLVGPRPHPAASFEMFTLVARNLNEVTGSAVGYYSLRSMVRPGITGWAQVRYRYANDLDEEIEKLRYDLFYIKYVSPLLDLRIMLDTVLVMVKGHPNVAAGEARPAGRVLVPVAAQLTGRVGRTQAA